MKHRRTKNVHFQKKTYVFFCFFLKKSFLKLYYCQEKKVSLSTVVSKSKNLLKTTKIPRRLNCFNLKFIFERSTFYWHLFFYGIKKIILSLAQDCISWWSNSLQITEPFLRLTFFQLKIKWNKPFLTVQYYFWSIVVHHLFLTRIYSFVNKEIYFL